MTLKQKHISTLIVTVVILMVSIILSSCSIIKRSNQSLDYKPNTLYKSWFFNTPANTIVGYQTSVDLPYLDGKIRFNGYRETRVKGFLRQYHADDDFNEQDSIYFYTINDTVFFDSVVVLDSFFLSKFYVYLFALGNKTIHKGNAYLYELETVSWLKETPKENGKIFAKSSKIFTYYDQASSWMQAEEDAIKNLCQNSVIHLETLQMYNSNNNNEELSDVFKVTLDLTVKNINIVQRYYDVKTQTCHVLVSCKSEDIVPVYN